MGLESCTAEVQVTERFAVDGRTVTLIDTPGFDDTSKSDTEILKMIALFLATTLAHTSLFHLLTPRLNFPTDTKEDLPSLGSSTSTGSPTIGSVGSPVGISTYSAISAVNQR